MSLDGHDFELRERLEELEYRIQEFSDEQNDSIENRDRLLLDAAWGVVLSLNRLFAAVLPVFVGLSVLELKGWALAGFILLGWAALSYLGWKNYFKGWEGDKEKLSTLPRWKLQKWHHNE